MAVGASAGVTVGAAADAARVGGAAETPAGAPLMQTVPRTRAPRDRAPSGGAGRRTLTGGSAVRAPGTGGAARNIGREVNPGGEVNLGGAVARVGGVGAGAIRTGVVPIGGARAAGAGTVAVRRAALRWL